MLNKQLWALILPGGVRARLNVITLVLFAFLALASCEDPMNDITKSDPTEIVTGACGDCKENPKPPTTGG